MREAELGGSEALLRAAIESAADGVLVIDRAGAVILANRKLHEMFQIPDDLAESGSGRALLDRIALRMRDSAAFKDRIAALEADCADCADCGGASLHAVELADGRCFECFARPACAGGRTAGYVWTFHDISDRASVEAARAEAEETAKQAAFLAQASSILSASLDYETTLAKVARLAIPTFADSCIVDLRTGREIRRITAAHVDASKEPSLEELPTDALLERDPRNLRLVRALGMRSVLAMPMCIHGRCIGSITFQSAAAGRYAGRELPFARKLADRCAVAIENAQLYADAQRSIRVRDDFVTMASHELRTPLTPLRMQLDLLRSTLQGDATALGAKRARLLALLESSDRQLGRLSDLVEDLLDVSRVNAGLLELRREEVELGGVARAVVERLAGDLSRAGCAARVTAEAPVVGRWDRSRLEQVVTQLLVNALKFGRGKPIELRVTKEGDRARLAVQDRGAGIALADQARIFDRFERAVSVKSFEGLGLGLFLARQIVLAHEGTISVESRPDAGATFLVELPLAPG